MDGKKIGTYNRYYKNNQKKITVHFQNGKKHGYLKHFFKNGKIRDLYSIQFDKIQKKISYHSNGNYQTTILYQNGKKNGKYESYNENGDLSEQGFYFNGELEGERRKFENGDWIEKSFFKNGKKNGFEYEFSENIVKKIKYYQENRLEGIQVSYPFQFSFYRKDFKICSTQSETSECSICWENTTWKTPCGHFICCTCIPQLINMSCPMCRYPFKETIF